MGTRSILGTGRNCSFVRRWSRVQRLGNVICSAVYVQGEKREKKGRASLSIFGAKVPDVCLVIFGDWVEILCEKCLHEAMEPGIVLARAKFNVDSALQYKYTEFACPKTVTLCILMSVKF